MSGDVKAAIAETQARAKEFLFGRDGKRRTEEHYVYQATLQTVLRHATIEEAMNPQDDLILFDWKGTSLVYNAGFGDLFVAAAREGDAGCDRMLCKAAAVMLDGAGCIKDRLLRAYIRDRLLGGVAPKAKPKRGRNSKDTWGRDAVIVGRLIPPLLNRFSATRNAETRHIESACSITTIALGNVGVHMSEKRLENIWAKFAHLFVPAK
jgi:hypothetical protein